MHPLWIHGNPGKGPLTWPAEALGKKCRADVRKRLTETFGMDLAVSTPAEPQKFLVSEITRWGKVVKEHGIRAD